MLQRLIELSAPPSATEWICLLFILASLISCIVISELIRKHFHWSAEVTRKFVHISVGVLIFFAPRLFQSGFLPLLLAFCAILTMAFAIRMGLLVGMHGTSRFSYGTIFYPLSFLVLIVLFWNRHPEIISLSMLSLAIGDAAAAIVGESFQTVGEYYLTSDKKSIEGSIAMFLGTLVSLFYGLLILVPHGEQSIGYLIMIVAVAAIIATAWEALSSKGLDNFTVPMSVAFVLYYYLVPSPMQDTSRFTFGVVISIFIAGISYYVRFLSASGSVATFLLASTVYGLGGWSWTMPILTFFVLSSILSKAGKDRKKQFEHFFEKTSTRDWGQVAANGGIAGICILAQYLWHDFNFYPMYLGAVAAVTADTWGTEIGVWFHGKTISIARFRVVETGTNGGVSISGFVGGAAGSTVASVSALPWVPMERLIFSTALAGIIGSLVDSFIGGTIQATYQCAVCSMITERKHHCGLPTRIVRGIHWINNDTVNWICALTGAIVAWLLM